jgi:hypothetical protein
MNCSSPSKQGKRLVFLAGFFLRGFLPTDNLYGIGQTAEDDLRKGLQGSAAWEAVTKYQGDPP